MTESSFQYGGAKALVALHERHLREFLQVWREADGRELMLPESSDPNYASREALLAHVMGCAARYLVWMCLNLGIPVPDIEQRPAPEDLPARAEQHLEQVLEAWRKQLTTLTEERAYQPAHTSNWGPPYCIDAMLEHAVMHPVRHTYQLQELIAKQTSGDAA